MDSLNNNYFIGVGEYVLFFNGNEKKMMKSLR